MYFIQSPLNSKLSNSSVVDTRLENRFTGQEEITQHLKLVFLFALTALHTQGYQSAGGGSELRLVESSESEVNALYLTGSSVSTYILGSQHSMKYFVILRIYFLKIINENRNYFCHLYIHYLCFKPANIIL